MTRPLLITAALTLTALCAHADVWSLDSCISHARIHNLSVQSAQLQAQSGELDITEARDAYLPTLSASASESLAFGRGLTSNNTYADRNTTQFGWGVNLNLPLFQGLSAYRREQLAHANMRTLLAQVEAARDNITLNVIAAYLQALYTRELCEVAGEQAALSRVELQRRQEMFAAGKIPEVDLLEARAQLASDSVTVITSESDRQLALIDLARLLQLPPAEALTFDIAPVRGVAGVIPPLDELCNTALGNNSGIAANELAVEAAESQISLAYTGYIPRLSFSLGVGSSYYHLHGADNPTFARQMRDNYATNLGFSLAIPLFDAFQTRNSVRRAQVQRTQAQLQLDTTRDQLLNDIARAWHQARSAEAKLASAMQARQSTLAAFEAMQDKYAYGRANAAEIEQAKTAYIRSLAESVQAEYELMLRCRVLQFYSNGY